MKELTLNDCNSLIKQLESQPTMSIKEEKYYSALLIARSVLQPVDTTPQQYESLVRKNV